MLQPGLVQLQPNLDDFMDIVEPLHGECYIIVWLPKVTYESSKFIYILSDLSYYLL